MQPHWVDELATDNTTAIVSLLSCRLHRVPSIEHKVCNL